MCLSYMSDVGMAGMDLVVQTLEVEFSGPQALE